MYQYEKCVFLRRGSRLLSSPEAAHKCDSIDAFTRYYFKRSFHLQSINNILTTTCLCTKYYCSRLLVHSPGFNLVWVDFLHETIVFVFLITLHVDLHPEVKELEYTNKTVMSTCTWTYSSCPVLWWPGCKELSPLRTGLSWNTHFQLASAPTRTWASVSEASLQFGSDEIQMSVSNCRRKQQWANNNIVNPHKDKRGNTCLHTGLL